MYIHTCIYISRCIMLMHFNIIFTEFIMEVYPYKRVIDTCDLIAVYIQSLATTQEMLFLSKMIPQY